MRRTELHKPDMVLFAVIMTLSIFGLLMVLSASMSEGRDSTSFFTHQLRSFVVALPIMACTYLIDYRRWRNRIAYTAFVVSVLALVAVDIWGHTVNGAQRWIFDIPFQPSEFAKLAVILFAAEWLPRKGDDVRSIGYGLIPFAILIGIVVSLVKAQPDMGTAAVILLTAGSLFIVSGAEIWQALVAAAATGAVLFVTAETYQVTRMTHFWEPCSDMTPKLEQVCQGIIAMGSGGLIGLGAGSSRFRWLLNAPYSDSILGIIGEELGLFGTLFVVAMIGLIVYRGFRIALQTPDSFGRLVAAGISLWIGIQAAINLAGNTALIPFTGVPLPFISFGGSSLISLLAASGILLNISRQTQEAAEPTPAHRKG